MLLNYKQKYKSMKEGKLNMQKGDKNYWSQRNNLGRLLIKKLPWIMMMVGKIMSKIMLWKDWKIK